MRDQGYDTTNVNVFINPVNDTPVFISEAVTAATEDVIYNYSVTAADVDAGDELVITASTIPGWLQLEDNGDGTGTLEGTPENPDVGDHAVVLRVTDGSGAFAIQSFTIAVENINDVPVFTSEAVTAATEDAIYSYSVTANDVDAGDELVITASTIPGWLQLVDNGDGTGTLSGTPLNDQVGDHEVELLVTDLDGATGIQSFTITVENTNDAPVFSSEAVTAATEDVVYTYSVTATDVDAGDALVITASTIPGWLELTDNGNGTGSLEGTPLNENIGNHSIVLKVTDESGVFAIQSFVIIAENTNDAPTIELPDSLTFSEDGFLTEDFSDYIEDMD